MKKRIGITVFTVIMLALTVVLPAYADNGSNESNGWAHYNVISVTSSSVTLEFVSTRSFASCFEYRANGEAPTATPHPYNPSAGPDGIWPFKCVNNSTTTVTIPATDYVEVRMIFGAESDERFSWERIDLIPGVPDVVVAPERSLPACRFVGSTPSWIPYGDGVPISWSAWGYRCSIRVKPVDGGPAVELRLSDKEFLNGVWVGKVSASGADGLGLVSPGWYWLITPLDEKGSLVWIGHTSPPAQ